MALTAAFVLAACASPPQGTPQPKFYVEPGPEPYDGFVRAVGAPPKLVREAGLPVYRVVYWTIQRANPFFVATINLSPNGDGELDVYGHKDGEARRWRTPLTAAETAAARTSVADPAFWRLPLHATVPDERPSRSSGEEVCVDGVGLRVEAWDGARFVQADNGGACHALPAFRAAGMALIELVGAATGMRRLRLPQ